MNLRKALSALLAAAMICGLLTVPTFAVNKTFPIEIWPDNVTMTMEIMEYADVPASDSRFPREWGAQEFPIYFLSPDSPIILNPTYASIKVSGCEWTGEAYGITYPLCDARSGSTARQIMEELFHGTAQLFTVYMGNPYAGFACFALAGEELPHLDGLPRVPFQPDSSSQQPSDWARGIVRDAQDLGLLCFDPTGLYLEKITRLQFAQLAVKLMERRVAALEPAPAGTFTDTTDPMVLKAAKLGVVSGTGEQTFSPDDPVTRQEVCVMLSRVMEYLDGSVDTAVIADHSTELDAGRFNDADKVAPWAREGVAMLTNNGVMSGSDGGIAPEDNTTVEQAIALILAIWNLSQR